MSNLETVGPSPVLAVVPERVVRHVPPSERQGAWIVARREMVDLLSDWRILGPALLLVVVFPILLVIMSAQGRGLLARRYPSFSFESVVPFAMMLVGFLPVSFSLMVALESFAGERERNTLEALLSTPLGDRALYLGKLLASLLPPLLGSYLSMGLYLGGTMVAIGYRPAWAVVGALALLNLAQATIMVASALIVSSHTTSVRAANLLAAFIILPMSVLIQLNNALILWGGAPALGWIALGLGVFGLLLIRMGVRLFNREQILAREMDDLRPRRLSGTFAQLWRLPPRQALALRTPGADLTPARPWSLGRLYRRDIPTLLHLRRPELALVGVTLAVALLLGGSLAQSVRLDLLGAVNGLPAGSALAGQVQAATAGSHNLLLDVLGSVPGVLLRLVILSVLLIALAVISFGTLPMLLMMLLATGVGFVLGQLALAGTSPVVLGVLLLTPPILLPALTILLLTAFAVRFGLIVANPPPGFSLGDSLLLALVEYCKILALALPLLLLGQIAQVLLLALTRGVFAG